METKKLVHSNSASIGYVRMKNSKTTNVKVPTITMDELTQLQNDYVFFTDMLKSLERKKKKTPGTGFAKIKCVNG